MKSLLTFGLATLIFVSLLAACPAAHAWQSGRWTNWSSTSPSSGAVVVATAVTTGVASAPAAATPAPWPTPPSHATVVVAVSSQSSVSTVPADSHRTRPATPPAPRPTSRERRAQPRKANTPTPDPTPSASATPTPDPSASSSPAVPLTGTTISVPSGASKAQIDACVVRAVAAGAGTWVVFPAGTFAYAGTFTVPDGINVRGQGIWDQGAAGGAGGTWLQCTKGMRWGSDSTIEYLLVGTNTPGGTCTFRPVARGSSAAGPETRVDGSHDCTFQSVRFKGGSDGGAPLIDLGTNFSSTWSSSIKTCDMVDTKWYDCEFERPQVTNATAGTSGGAIMNIWLDSRAGGARVYGNVWYRCHFGVENGYHSGIDGYGIGRTILFQPAPAEHGADGPRPSGKPVNMSFDWSQVDHGFSDNRFVECLFEYSLWYPMDVCDYARSYSLTNLFGGVVGGNPPTASQAAAIPPQMWNDGLSITDCYFKGSYPAAHGVVYEIGRDAKIVDSSNATGGFGVHSGSFGNLQTGSFTNSLRPDTAAFTTDWTGAQTSYTPSPYDP